MSDAGTSEPLWRMSLAGSELARIAPHGELEDPEDRERLDWHEGCSELLVFAVAQVLPVLARRFGRGDDTAYLSGVPLRLEGVEPAGATGRVPDGLVGRLTECGAHGLHDGQPAGRSWATLPLPGHTAGPLTLTLRSALGAEWTVGAQGLSLLLGPSDGRPASAWPSLAC